MKFEPLYLADRIQTINPQGDIGVITLWSKVDAVKTKLAAIDPALLDPETSRIAAIANLYGDGMFAMFVNLLNNPQIRYLVAMGQDLGLPVCKEIAAFLDDGLEPASVLGSSMFRVKGTDRIFPAVAGFDEKALRSNLKFRNLGKLSAPTFAQDLVQWLESLPRRDGARSARVAVTIPQSGADDFKFLPSLPVGHQVIRFHPLQCWEELMFRTMKFGRPVQLRKGLRLELQNVKAVISRPLEDDPALLQKYGFNIEGFHRYQKAILNPVIPEDTAYTYGNRLRGYFGGEEADTLATVIARFKADPETRHGYISLWDTARDLSHPDDDDDTAVPCLVSLFFRRTEETLGLAATYRSHNLLTAWLENVYGLMSIQRYVAEAIGMPTGPITVHSHSLGINPESTRFHYAQGMLENWRSDNDFDQARHKSVLREDPQGYFVVSADKPRKMLIAEHRYGGVLLKRYEGRRAEDVEREIARDMAVSVISHAMWIGRELARNERSLAGADERET